MWHNMPVQSLANDQLEGNTQSDGLKRGSPLIALTLVSLRNRTAKKEDGKTFVCGKRDRAITCVFVAYPIRSSTIGQAVS